MVVESPPDATVDDLFGALADATRRDILRRCAAGRPSVTEVANGYPISFAAVQKHVAVLERAGLVTKTRRGREQLVRTDAGALRRARHALEQLEAIWRARIDRMSDELAQARPRAIQRKEGDERKQRREGLRDPDPDPDRRV